MKKLLLFIPVLLTSCVNPSMERGFEGLSEALTFIAEDLTFYAESITRDLAKIEDDIYLIAAHIEKIQENMQEALRLMDEILSGLDRVRQQLEEAATKEQMENLLEDVQEFQEGVRVLWNLADFDADGVVNGLDQCPETPYGILVDWKGCSADQTPVSGTTTNTI